MKRTTARPLCPEDAPPGAQGIVKRRLQLCERLQSWSFGELLKEEIDHEFEFAYNEDNLLTGCHHFKVVFSDGACRNNGFESATAGAGVAYGLLDHQTMAITIDDTYGVRKTSQRAELIAAVEAVKVLNEICHPPLKPHYIDETKHCVGPCEGIVITDSEYVVRGMTEWMPVWKNKNWKTTNGKPPQNIDLFKLLDSAITEAEMQGIKIGFYHVDRENNAIADYLAKDAAGVVH